MYFKTGILVLIMAFSFTLNAQFDDLYYDYATDEIAYTKTEVADSNKGLTKGNYAETEEYNYDSEEYSNYDEYSYTDRINRFHTTSIANDYYYNSFDDWWYYDNYNYPSYSSFYPSYRSGINIYIGNSWGFNRGYSPWGWNNYYSGFNNRYSPWGYNSWGYNSWGYNPYYSPWGGSNYYGGNNYYYGDVYYGNGWYDYNNPGSNSGNTNKTIYGSRKAGAVSSSVNGREASPRKPATDNGIKDGVRQVNVGEDLKQDDKSNSSSIRVKNTEDVKRTETLRKEEINNNPTERVRIYNTDKSKINSNEGVRSNSNTNPTIRNKNTTPTDRSNIRTNTQPSSTRPSSTRPNNNIRVAPTKREPSSTPRGTINTRRTNQSRNIDNSDSFRSNSNSGFNSGSYRESSSPSRSSGTNSSGSFNSSRQSSGSGSSNSSSSRGSQRRGG